ncbi:MAG: hypothetical protein HOQ45_10680 [Nocardioidaceae bacterium]|nr:hypothetical protein [Nocardioidaceae bacterium]
MRIDRSVGAAEAADGSRRPVLFSDDALLVWACPSCEYTQAEDLTT